MKTYRVEHVKELDLAYELARFSRQGWELQSALPNKGGDLVILILVRDGEPSTSSHLQ